MPQPNSVVKTWRDFPDFYGNPFVKALADKEKWTVSDKNKRPIDMRAFIDRQKIWGVAYNRGYNPFVDLQTVCDTIPTAVNNTFYLDALEDGYVVMDIEPRCPKKLQKQFLSLPYIYGETSMSGKGLHLVFELPKEIMDKYPIAQRKLALKHDSGYYEILLNHMVTFTRNSLPPSDNKQGPDAFLNIFELLAMEAKETNAAKGTVVDSEIDTDTIPNYDSLMRMLRHQDYKKSPSDFSHGDGSIDMSKYEFGMAGFYYHTLSKVMPKRKYKGHEYTDEEYAIIIYKMLEQKVPHRDKHDQSRSGMPWLCYIASTIVAKNSSEPESKG